VQSYSIFAAARFHNSSAQFFRLRGVLILVSSLKLSDSGVKTGLLKLWVVTPFGGAKCDFLGSRQNWLQIRYDLQVFV